jgi:hypothetical protein
MACGAQVLFPNGRMLRCVLVAPRPHPPLCTCGGGGWAAVAMPPLLSGVEVFDVEPGGGLVGMLSLL